MIVLVDTDMGNVGSILNMLRRVGQAAKLSRDPADLMAADALILPGVGHFDRGMDSLHERGLVDTLHECVLERRIPILGICLGMQLLTEGSEEGNRPGLGWIKGFTKRFDFAPGTKSLRIPHMGWAELTRVNTKPGATLADGLFSRTPADARFYFVHTYHAHCAEPRDVLATATYGYEFTAAIGRDHIAGTQFHPEKSLRFGVQLMQTFAELCARRPVESR